MVPWNEEKEDRLAHCIAVSPLYGGLEQDGGGTGSSDVVWWMAVIMWMSGSGVGALGGFRISMFQCPMVIQLLSWMLNNNNSQQSFLNFSQLDV
jgi:hypothetical protein